jgi:hypothetical protein
VSGKGADVDLINDALADVETELKDGRKLKKPVLNYFVGILTRHVKEAKHRGTVQAMIKKHMQMHWQKGLAELNALALQCEPAPAMAKI